MERRSDLLESLSLFLSLSFSAFNNDESNAWRVEFRNTSLDDATKIRIANPRSKWEYTRVTPRVVQVSIGKREAGQKLYWQAYE